MCMHPTRPPNLSHQPPPPLLRFSCWIVLVSPRPDVGDRRTNTIDGLECLQALQGMVREQALQIGALRIQAAFRGRGQAAELERLRQVRQLSVCHTTFCMETIIFFMLLRVLCNMTPGREQNRRSVHPSPETKQTSNTNMQIPNFL